VGPVAAEGVGLVAAAAVELLDWRAESSGLTAAAYSTIYKENSKSTQVLYQEIYMYNVMYDQESISRVVPESV
jgi:hypothetical protein